jgi:Undecaprenyl-phosphate glucose phosphotransferase
MTYTNNNNSTGGAHKTLALSSLETFPRRRVNWTISYRLIAPVAITCDALIIFAMGIGSSVAYNIVTIGGPGHFALYGGLAAIAAALFIALGKNNNLYAAAELLNFKSQARHIAANWIGILLFLAAVAFAMKIGPHFSRGATMSFAISSLAGLITLRAAWRLVLADGLAVSKFSGRKIALIAEQALAIDSGLLEAFTRHGLQLAHHFVLPANRNDTQGRKSVIAQAISSVRGSDIEEIVVAANLDHWSELNVSLSDLRVLPIPVNLVPVGPSSDLFRLPSHTIGDTVTIELQRGPRTLFERFVKRIIDLVIAGTALVLLLPLFLMTALAIKLDSPGPVMFRQRRCGFNGRPFQIFKFRTMSVLEDGETIVQAELNDHRVTTVGSWLRRTSIDELPQLFNVLQGNMSIVGPRPHALVHDDQFDKLVGNYAFRQHVKPGITGWAQINGFRGRTRTVADIEQRIRFDLWYIDNWSLAFDFKIILLTVFEVFRGRNAY